MINKKFREYPLKGINYKSKGELEIAKFLTAQEINFEYEFPIAVKDEDKTKLWYPDFYLTDYQIVIEYFGMYIHDQNYKKSADHKKGIYKQCGIFFVPMYHFNKDWKNYILDSILSHLEGRVDAMKNIIEVYEKTTKKKYGFFEKLKFWNRPQEKSILGDLVKSTTKKSYSKPKTATKVAVKKTYKNTYKKPTKKAYSKYAQK